MAYGSMVNMDVNKVSSGISERIEPGIYEVAVKDIDRIALKGGASGYGAKFKFEILNEGPMKGRDVGDLLNIESTSADAQRIAKERLAGLAVNTGIPESAIFGQQIPIDNLIGRQLSVVLGPQKDAPQYVEVKGYLPLGSSADPEAWRKSEHLMKEPAQTQPKQTAAAAQGAWGGQQPAQQAPAQQQPAAGGWGGQQQPAQQQPAAAPNGPAQQPAAAAPRQSTWGSGPS